MGKLKRRRQVRGAVFLLTMIGLLAIGMFAVNYFQANAAGKSANQANNEPMKKANAAMMGKGAHDDQQEKEMIRKQMEKAMAFRNEQEKRKDQENPSQPAAAQPPAQPNGKRTIYLTFDDGPSAISGDIIALLEQHHFKGTFFMIDGNIRKYPDAAKLMVQTGEAVGLHSVSHRKEVFYASADSVLGELTQNRNTLREITRVDSFLARTPYGSSPYMTPQYKQVVKDNGYFMWDWNIDSKDWYYKDARYIDNVIAQLNAKAGHNGPLVILLHEKKETLAHLPQLLDYLTQQGFESKAIDSTIPPVQF
ncbi:polysaccharide deacetylase family protein [Neobacillus citreus]|uniref:Polysaccharide deacetylase family protein n=1 Tax=Neobacillus citreus TaxID=2833578 RepID=A0A942T1E9_9BACI|nr:polysaccharide deacetylase family protein [Neobacillus citreus]MCH6267620.1 polysaccharide deacetylase family protein [Neobacillus citreus]